MASNCKPPRASTSAVLSNQSAPWHTEQHIGFLFLVGFLQGAAKRFSANAKHKKNEPIGAFMTSPLHSYVTASIGCSSSRHTHPTPLRSYSHAFTLQLRGLSKYEYSGSDTDSDEEPPNGYKADGTCSQSRPTACSTRRQPSCAPPQMALNLLSLARRFLVPHRPSTTPNLPSPAGFILCALTYVRLNL